MDLIPHATLYQHKGHANEEIDNGGEKANQ